MVTTEAHQSQDLMVPAENQAPNPERQAQEPAPGSSPLAGFDPEKFSQGPVNAITVLTLLDKLVNMLDAVQETQDKMEMHQVEMEGVVKGIQADMTKLSKCHSHTSNTVSKLLDKSRKLSVTMKEVRDRMEHQDAQVKKLEANHAHLINRNKFKVLIFKEENEIPASVFSKDSPPFPRDELLEQDEESVQGQRFHSVDLSSDEELGLEDDEDQPWNELREEMRPVAKAKRSSSLKMVDLKTAFSRHNIEKKMNKLGTKLVSPEQREKIKWKTQSLKLSSLSFGSKKPRHGSDSQPPEASGQTGASISIEADILQPPAGPGEQEEPADQRGRVEDQPELEKEVEVEKVSSEVLKVVEEEAKMVKSEVEEEEDVRVEGGSVEVEAEVSAVSEGVHEEYALSSTLPQEESGAEVEQE